jgi:lysophospholipase L1-like esterase
VKKTIYRVSILVLLLAIISLRTAASEPRASTPDQPAVLIIGDSIAQGYTPHVKQLLKTEARVTRQPGNAEHTGTGLKNLDAWLSTNRWAVIHFNWGLHDLCYRNPQSKTNAGRDRVQGQITTSLEQYEKNLEQLVTRLEQTGAVLIWASTTFMPDGDEGRFAGDEQKYNAVAARMMQRHGIRINDLHARTAGFTPELFLKPGDVHFKPAGYQKIAIQVADQIRAALKAVPARAPAPPKPAHKTPPAKN